MRFADDFVAGFEHRDDAERFLAELRDRLAKFSLELHAEKTRLIQFGRFAARNARQRDLGKPETFDFLGFTHICGKTRSGSIRADADHRLEADAGQATPVKARAGARRYLPIPEQGRWLASVVRGHCAYYAVPGNSKRSTRSAKRPSSTGIGRCGAGASAPASPGSG